MTETDGVLLESWSRRGDAAAFEELYRRHGAMVHAACLRRLGAPAEAEDAAAAVFVILMRKAGSLRSRPSLAGWLQWCAANVARKAAWLRARRAEREKEAAEMQSRAQREESTEWRSALPHLDEAMAALPAAQRDVLVLQYL
jgi:RNA polymerase sigma factor (sigma-70 family)